MRSLPTRPFVLATLLAGLLAPSVLAAPPGQRKTAAHEYVEAPASHVTQPNLVMNGDFEKTVQDVAAKKAMPAYWGKFGTDQVGTGPISVPDAGAPHGKVLRLTANEKQATSTGVFVYSEAIPVKLGRTYDITMDIQTDGIGVIVFVKGYGVVTGGTFGGREREIYRHKKEALLQPGGWMPFVSYFTPTEPAGQEVLRRRGVAVPELTNVRVDLYIYGGKAGVADFDNVRVTERPEEAKTEGAAATPQDPDAKTRGTASPAEDAEKTREGSAGKTPSSAKVPDKAAPRD